MSTPFYGADGAGANPTASNERKPRRGSGGCVYAWPAGGRNHIKKDWPLEFRNGWNSDRKDVLRIARMDTSFLSYRTQVRSCLLRNNPVAIHLSGQKKERFRPFTWNGTIDCSGSDSVTARPRRNRQLPSIRP